MPELFPVSYLYPGQIFVELDNSAVVVSGLSVHSQGLHNLHDSAGQGHRDANLMGGIEGVSQVLYMQLDSKTGLEIAIKSQRHFCVEHRR